MNRAVNKRFGGAVRWHVQTAPLPESRGLRVVEGESGAAAAVPQAASVPQKKRASKKNAA